MFKQGEGKLIAVRRLIQEGLKPPALVFVQSIGLDKELFHMTMKNTGFEL
ncbi:8535_t:CDS:2 [Entrophospora sp. SA101]|nr:8535_t:CDS:2 [Entrophospora sp. SA101]